MRLNNAIFPNRFKQRTFGHHHGGFNGGGGGHGEY